MNLGKLLRVGNSFFGGGQPAAYRMNRAGLPKFNEGRNPFASKKDEPDQAAEPASTAPTVPAAAAAPKTPARSFVPFLGRHQSKPAAKAPRASWTMRLNPFHGPAKAPAPAAVQSELTLDAVKVVHNDLADADVEIVPVSSHASAPATPVLPPARRAWEYVGENLLKST